MPGKFGWLACDGGADAQLAMSVACERGELLVGYLESYHEAMGAVRVRASRRGAGAARELVVDARRADVHESVFRIARLAGLAGDAAEPWWVTFSPVGPSAAAASGAAPPRRAPNATARCHAGKFKLLTLACT